MGLVMQLNVGFASSEWITLAPGRIATRCVESDGFHYRASIFPSTGAEAGSFLAWVSKASKSGAPALCRESARSYPTMDEARAVADRELERLHAEQTLISSAGDALPFSKGPHAGLALASR